MSGKDPDKIEIPDILNFFWKEGDLEYKLDSLQTSIGETVRTHFSNSKKICILSSRQIGKSFWVMTFALEFLIRNPGTICRVIAPTREKCEEIVEDNLNVILQDVPEKLIAHSTSKNRWNFFNGSSLRLGALERQYVDKNRGGNASLIIYEECGFVSGDDFLYGVNSVIGPQLLRSKGHEIFVSSPSEQPDHPLHTIIAPACANMGTLFQYMVFESPSISDQAIIEAAERSGTVIDIDLVAAIRARVKSGEKILPEDVHVIARLQGIPLSDGFRREFMAEIIRPSSLMVVPIFNERQSVFDFEVPQIANYMVVVDWGGVRDKTVALLMAYEFNGDVDLVVDEKVFDCNTSTEKIITDLKTWHEHFEIESRWADVPGQLQVDLKEDWDYAVAIPPKSNWIASVNTMAARFAVNKIKIKPKCKFLLASVRSGMFNKTRTDFARSEELGHMDALAALMYGIRCQNRDNPYPNQIYAPNSHRFVNPEAVEKQTSLGSLGGKSFGSFKK